MAAVGFSFVRSRTSNYPANRIALAVNGGRAFQPAIDPPRGRCIQPRHYLNWRDEGPRVPIQRDP